MISSTDYMDLNSLSVKPISSQYDCVEESLHNMGGITPIYRLNFKDMGTELEFVIMVIAVSCVKLLSAHNSTQHTSRKHKV
jgi:hypothetical protein